MNGTLATTGGTVAAIVVVVVLDLFAVVFGLSFVRSRRAKAEAELTPLPARPAVGEAAPKTTRSVTRREFFRRSLLCSLGVFAAQFGGATLAFLWPRIVGFGSVINAGKIDDIKSAIHAEGEPFYLGAGRFYIVAYNGHPTGDVDYVSEGVATQGIMSLYQRCVHLGCRVPFCKQSSWFECPCHGSKYNGAGEYELGPAPRGLDRFKVTVTSDGELMVDTSQIILGPPRGTSTTSQAHGPFCVAPA